MPSLSLSHWSSRAWLGSTLIACLSACATVSVAPGHGAVLLTASGTMTVLGEGITAVPQGSQLDDFNLRQEGQGVTFAAITADGVPIEVRDSVIDHHLVAAELVALDREVGTNYRKSLIEPILQWAIAKVLATYRFDELDTDRIRQAQQRVTTLAGAELLPHHIAIDSIELKGLFPALPGLATAVTETAVWEQRSAEAKSRLDIARQRADALRTKASGIAAANDTVAPTLVGGVLGDEGNKAWQQLIASPTTTVHVAPANSPMIEVTP